jgi:Tol biopolymer transport system component/DNA-binding winged helix-turn-helix (wHTH) protein
MFVPDQHLYDFGPYRLDMRERVLLRAGEYIALTPKAFETLVVLVEHRGRIVDKDELLHVVWPDTFVEEATLTKTVSILRKALGENEGHRYIDTIPKRGYRFTAEVEIKEAPPDEGAKPRKWNWKWAGALAGAFVLAGTGFWVVRQYSPFGGSAAALRMIPLTSYPGHQNQAAFSPDGNQVAFIWDGAQGGPSHVYVKMTGSEALHQLTRAAAADSRPAWSPDGSQIAFLRSSAGGRAWYLISALGGPERKVADVLPYFDLGAGNSASFAPDGLRLAIVDKRGASDPSAIFLLSIENSTRVKLTTPPPGSTGDYYPAFSPDGKHLAFARAVSFSATDLHVIPLAGGQPKRLTFDGLTIDGLAWAADSREIVFSSRRGGSLNSLWRIRVTGGTPERIGTFGEDVISPAIAHAGGRMAYTRLLDDMNIWSFQLTGPAKVGAKTPLVVSTFRDSDPDFSPDGRRIAFTSGRHGGFGIWVSDADGTDPRLIFDGGPYVTGSPRWSPDGRWIAFDTRANDPARAGNPSVWVADAERGEVRRLTGEGTGDVAPSWSHDGVWIYFASTRGGTLQIWKMPARGGAAVQVTRGGGFEAFESDDGRFLLYTRGREIPGIWRVPVGGGEETLITDRDQIGYRRCWRLAHNRIYFGTAAQPDGPRLEVLDLVTGAVQLVTPLAKAPDLTIPSLAVAPDGASLLLTQFDQSGSNLILVEQFR